MAKSKKYIKDYVKVYNNITVTFKEFFDALKKLGYKDVSTSTHLRFQKVANSTLSIPMRSLDDKMQESDFRTYSYIIYMKDDIEHPDDLAKMIEKNREKANVEMSAA